MEELFVPHPIAVLARNKGFKEGCLAFYDKEGEFNFIQKSPEDGGIKNPIFGDDSAAPLYQQLVDWFRVKYNLEIRNTPYYGPDGYMHGWSYLINEINKEGIYKQPMGFFKTYNLSLETGIEEAFKLI